ncbi:MAG: hypothetical protein ACAH88_01405 [Roseimicrobium sp.]
MSFAPASFSSSSLLRACGRWLAKGWCIFALILPPALTSGAQDAAPDLRVLKAQLRRELLTAALPEHKTHREELLTLEKKYAASQDYAGAIKARDERLRIEQEISLMEKELTALAQRPGLGVASRAPERIELNVAEATYAGVHVDPADKCVTGWGSVGASVTWKLPNLPPGGYEVTLSHQGGEATATLRESFYSLSTGLKPASGKAVAQSLGTLRVRDGTGTLTLTMSPPEKCTALRVYSLVLVPASR